jgi:hypothetical protein
MISIPTAPADRNLLLDRDECGGVKLWHGHGTVSLTDEQLTELVLSAVPGGSKRLSFGDHLAKSYISRLGIIAMIWKPAARR